MPQPLGSSNTLEKNAMANDNDPDRERVAPLSSLSIRIFADTAHLSECISLNQHPLIRGFTTNPSLMRSAGITNYEHFCRTLLETIQDKPVSFEVFADDLQEMERQARIIAGWAQNAVVKIPVTNTRGTSTANLVRTLIDDGVPINVTAVFTKKQIDEVASALHGAHHAYLSVFAGRIADTGRDPSSYVRHAVDSLRTSPGAMVIWASTRELYNIYQAVHVSSHIITVTPSLISKFSHVGYSLNTYSLSTVTEFYKSASQSSYTL